MLYERKQLPELLYMKHRSDTDDDFVKYDDKILDNSLTPYIFKNDMMFGFLKRLQPLVSILFDHMNSIKNWKNYIVDSYNYKHIK